MNSTPVQLLGYIFQLSVQQWLHDQIYPGERVEQHIQPLRLIHVCRHWRMIASELPSLWQYRVVLPCIHTSPDADCAIRTECLQRLFDILCRSADLKPLVFYRRLRPTTSSLNLPCSYKLAYIVQHVLPRTSGLWLSLDTLSARFWANALPSTAAASFSPVLRRMTVHFDQEDSQTISQTQCGVACNTIAPCLDHAFAARHELYQKLRALFYNHVHHALWSDIFHSLSLNPQVIPFNWQVLRRARLNMLPVDHFIAIAHATHPGRQLECLRIGGVYSLPGPSPYGTPVAENVILGPHTLALEGTGDLDTIFHALKLEALQSLKIRCQRRCSFSLKELHSFIGRTKFTMTKLSIDHQYDNVLDEGDLVALLANSRLQDLTELRLHFSNLSFGDKFYTKLTAGRLRQGPLLPKLRVLDIGTCGSYTDGKLGRMLRSRQPGGGYPHPLVDVKLAFDEEEVDHSSDGVCALWVAEGKKGYIKDSPVVQQLPFVHISRYEMTDSDMDSSEDDDDKSIDSEVVREENEAPFVTVQLGDEQIELRGLITH